jgi:intein/homing endonuclease
MSFINDNEETDNLLNFEDDIFNKSNDLNTFDALDNYYPLFGNGSYKGNVPCFLKSTKILTINGEKKIEELKKGDLLICYDERIIEIKDIYSFTCKDLNKYNIPYKIPKNTKINDRVCNDDLYLSPLHQVLFRGNLFTFVKNLNFRQLDISEIETNTITYYHIVLPNYYTDAVIANGIICEGFSEKLSKNLTHNKMIFSKIYKGKYRKLLRPNEFNKIINPVTSIRAQQK